MKYLLSGLTETEHIKLLILMSRMRAIGNGDLLVGIEFVSGVRDFEEEQERLYQEHNSEVEQYRAEVEDDIPFRFVVECPNLIEI